MNEEILKIVSKERNSLQNLLKFAKNINKYQNDPPNNLNKIKQEMLKIEKILEQSKLENFVKEKIEECIQSIKSKVVKWEEDVRKTFGQKLEDGLRKAGFELRGNYPLLKVSFYTLEVDLENFKVLIWYGPKQEKLDTCKLIPEEVVKKLNAIHTKLTQRHFDDGEFLSKIYEAYRIFVYGQNKKIGDQIHISDILFEYVFLIQDKKFKINPIKNNYREYGRACFSYDLYQLKERIFNNMELNLITATRAYTRKKSDFLWIPSNEKGDGNYISHIKFREVRA